MSFTFDVGAALTTRRDARTKGTLDLSGLTSDADRFLFICEIFHLAPVEQKIRIEINRKYEGILERDRFVLIATKKFVPALKAARIAGSRLPGDSPARFIKGTCTNATCGHHVYAASEPAVPPKCPLCKSPMKLEPWP